MFSPLYLKIFEKSPFLMKTPSQNFAHHTEVKKHPFGVKTPNLATLVANPPVGQCGQKLKGKNPPLNAENPTIFGQKIPHFEVFFFENLNPPTIFIAFLCINFFQIFFENKLDKKIFLNITERKILSEN